MSEIAVQEPQQIAQSPVQWAIANQVSPDQMLAYYQLQREMNADSARNAFFQAMAKFKANPPQINKNKRVSIDHKNGGGKTVYDHATLDHVVDMIAPALSAVGIRHRWETKQEPGYVTVTCILSHDMGHSESTLLMGPYDASGSKNAIQAIGSAVTYLQRYTLLSATGLAAANTDNDAKESGARLPEEEFLELRESIANASDFDELKSIYFAACESAKKIGDTLSAHEFEGMKNQRYRELSKGKR